MRKVLVVAVALLLTTCAAAEERVLEVQPLVSAEWLNKNLEAVIPLDVRQDRPGAVFADAHVPGATHSPYGQDPWRVTRNGVPGLMPAVADLELLIGALGIANDDYVVIVPQGQSAVEFGSATRIYWLFKVLGHEKVAILDGGFNAWLARDYSTERGVNRRPPATYTAEPQSNLVAAKQDVLAALETGIAVIDARSANYYRGEAKARIVSRSGTIRGAKNLPAERLVVGNTGALVDSTAAAALWTAAGIPLTGEQIVFCNIGHLASVAWFTAYEVLGNKQARLYDGSLAEWAADSELPMENTSAADRS
ncbi:MAG: rhodanese-like domain-containing protein [Gemmatimonadales bacterium]|jgi:thiosulfate/3-mercaptopyruvate sulfurtransferase